MDTPFRVIAAPCTARNGSNFTRPFETGLLFRCLMDNAVDGCYHQIGFRTRDQKDSPHHLCGVIPRLLSGSSCTRARRLLPFSKLLDLIESVPFVYAASGTKTAGLAATGEAR